MTRVGGVKEWRPMGRADSESPQHYTHNFYLRESNPHPTLPPPHIIEWHKDSKLTITSNIKHFHSNPRNKYTSQNSLLLGSQLSHHLTVYTRPSHIIPFFLSPSSHDTPELTQLTFTESVKAQLPPLACVYIYGSYSFTLHSTKYFLKLRHN